MTDELQLSVCVCTYNAAGRVARFLPPLVATVRTLDLVTELVVVDDGSDDDTAAVVRRLAPSAVVVEHGSNRGAPAARNTAARKASGEWLLFLDDDVVAEPAAIDALWVERNEEECLVPAVRDADGHLYNCYIMKPRFFEPKFFQQAEVHRHVAYPEGSCFFIHHDLFERSGGFDERFAPQFYEDAEFGSRLWKMGVPVRMVENAEVVHHPHGDDPSQAALDRIAGHVYERRWLYCLVSLSGPRRFFVILIGLPRTVRESARQKSLRPLLGYVRALRRWRTLAKTPRRMTVA